MTQLFFSFCFPPSRYSLGRARGQIEICLLAVDSSAMSSAKDSSFTSKMNIDDDIMNFSKKRPREEDAEHAFEKEAPNISRSVTTEEDDAFVSSLHGEDATSSAQSSMAYGATVSTAVGSKTPANEVPTAQSIAFNTNAHVDTKVEVLTKQLDAPHPPDMPTAPTEDSKMPAVEVHTMPADEVPKQQEEVALPTQFATLPPLPDMASMTQPPASTNMEKFVERWTCDVCKSCSFETFNEAHTHEIQCKLFHEAKKKSEEDQLKDQLRDQMSEAADVLTSLALRPPKKVQDGEADPELVAKRHPSINLIPQGEASSMLSDYNNLLVRHIEFFYPSSDDRVGLRCIHCKDHPQHITAATFFPSTIGSISSGLGTIGARHFGWGKCPFVQPETVQQMIETKKTSGLQTRSQGRVGLDAYCKNLAKQYGILDDENSGISWKIGTEPNFNITDDLLQRKLSTSSRESARNSSDPSSVTGNSIASVLANMKNDVNNIETRPFVPSDTVHFWECSGCRSIPFDFRTKGSVVFSVGEPTKDKVEGHLKNCTGGKPLAIPRSAAIEPYYCHDVPSVKVKWDVGQTTRSSGRQSRYDTMSIKAGLEDLPLCEQSDQQFTTEFAYFVVTQLKKCYLTKA